MKIGERYNPYKSSKFSGIPDWIHCRTELSDGAKSVLARLRFHAGKSGRCFPKHETLAKEVGKKIRQLRECIKELIYNNIISVERGSVKRGHRSAQYFFLGHRWMPDEMLDSELQNIATHYDPIPQLTLRNPATHFDEKGCRNLQENMSLIRSTMSPKDVFKDVYKSVNVNAFNKKQTEDQKQDQKLVCFEDEIREKMEAGNDKLQVCLELRKKYDGTTDGQNAENLYRALYGMQKRGAPKEIEKSWRGHWDIVKKHSTAEIEDGFKILDERIEKGTARNIGAVYVKVMEKIEKRGMAKAPAASHQNQTRKVA